MSTFGVKCAGHEGAGVIVKVGDLVKNLKVGQRAGFKPIVDVCHTCEQCRTGRETYCAKAIFTGLMADGKTFLFQFIDQVVWIESAAELPSLWQDHTNSTL
jgi:D-arabinose 1-dehydrogenase-like Zn-dependent alcohol dehydrogenase